MRARILLMGVAIAALMSPVAGAQTRRDSAPSENRIQTPRAGRVSMIGVRLDDVTAENVKTLKLSKAEGAIVEAVNPNSAAAAAGMREKDVIIAYDGERVRSASHLTRLVHETPVGREVPIVVMRDGRKTDLRIKPEAGNSWFDPRFGETMDVLMQGVRDGVREGLPASRMRSRLGVNVQDLSGQLPEYFGAKSGALVTSVQPDSPASHAGLKAGDVITAVNGKPVTSPRDLINAIPDAGETISVTIVREKKETTLRASL